MLIVLSPAKTLDFFENNSIKEHSLPLFMKEASKLVKIIKKFKPAQLSSLMGISAKLADLNYERFLKWDSEHYIPSAKHAVLAFMGDVYIGLDAQNLSNDELSYINHHVRILSGLYGLLSPFDLIREYRLEMGTALPNPKGTDLYKFWTKKITHQVKLEIEKSAGEKVLINLASQEYFKSIVVKDLKCRVITPVFKEYKDKEYKLISFFAKKARGLMTRFIAINNINSPEVLKQFNLEGYAFNEILSKPDEWVFTR
jgi:uncharacterized protein